ncbi:MAG: hypothetical protein KAY37_12890 [Phycisphaerae bacterium]|nr:hypothetical protein [Phycisphaerae bacterium]
MAKRGRKPKHYEHTDGRTYVGLSRRSNGRFFPVGRSDFSFGSDPDEAVSRFLRWQAEQDGEQAATLEDLSAEHALADAVALDRFIDRFGVADAPLFAERVPALRHVFGRYFRHLLATDPRRASVELDWADLRNLPRGAPPTIKLADVGALYVERKRGAITPKEVAKSAKST